MKDMPHRVLGIVVTYHPNLALFRILLATLASQVHTVQVVDNTPADEADVEELRRIASCAPGRVRVHPAGRNLGVAAAQNYGIRVALDEGFDYVLLCDQDSQPDADMVRALVNCLVALETEGVGVGCVCPQYFDIVTGQAFRFQVQRPRQWFYRSVAADPAEPWLEIVTAISSGSLIPRAALEAVGPMREDFFIDHVDTEWCHRARALGLRNFGTPHARLTHRLGDASIRIWFLGWRAQNEYSSVRLYYRFRNYVLVCRMPHVTWGWALRAGAYVLSQAYAHCLFTHARRANARAIARGICDGVRGRSGPQEGVH